MDNNLFSNSDHLHPGDFEPGSIESRAAARAVLCDPARPPILVTEYAEPMFDAAGRHIYGGRECDSRVALINGQPLERLENESLAEFKQRAINAVPAMRTAHVQMIPSPDGDA